MRKAIALVFLLILVTGTSSFAGTYAGGKQPKISIPDDYWYFGYVPRNTIVQHDYWVHNVGSDTLNIVKITAGCACTGTRIDKEVLAPQDSARLRAIFNSENIHGKVVKEINIMSDDPENPYLTVRYFAVVASNFGAVSVTPATVAFPQLSKADLRQKSTLEVTNSSETEFEFSVVETTDPAFVARFARSKLAPGAKSKLDVAVESVPENSGIINASITIEFTGDQGGQKDRITIPISGFYAPDKLE